MIKLKKNNPLDEVLDLLKFNNPLLGNISSDAIRPTAFSDLTGEKNTRLVVLGDSRYGLTGTITVDYNRVDLSTIFNKFGNVTKNPTLQTFGDGGTVTNISDIIVALNNMLGTSLTITGDYPDLANGTFNLPTKGAKITVTVNAANVVGNNKASSVRIKPGTSMTFDVVNKGNNISLKLITRNEFPFKKVNGDINWNLAESNQLGSLKRHPFLELYNEDFSWLFAQQPENIINFYNYSYYSDHLPAFKFQPYFLEAINAQLTKMNLPNMSITYDYEGWSFLYGVDPYSTPAQAYSKLYSKTADLDPVLYPYVNKNFKYVFGIPVTQNFGYMTPAVPDTPGIINTTAPKKDVYRWTRLPYIFHFNM